MLYAGDLFVHTGSPAIREFVAFTRGLVEDAFGGLDPETAQYDMDVEAYAAMLAQLKPAFIHHPESKRHLCAILAEHGCDPEDTYFDVPRLRTSTSDDYLTTGIAYAFHPHRDTWYSAPMMQVNWWLPIYDVVSGQRGGLPPGVLRPGGEERQRTLQLLRVEPRQPCTRGLPDRRGHAPAAQAGGADRPRPADPAGPARRRDDGVLRGAAALLGAQHLGPDPHQRGLPDRAPRRRRGRPRRPERRLALHGHDHA